jgi:hypothetical protein
MVRYVRKQAILAKMETTYGENSSPAAANAMLMTNVAWEPQAEEVNRDLLKAFMGHQGIQLTGYHSTLSGEIELAGAGNPGDMPAYAPLLRMCGFAATVTANEKVVFLPVSSAFESGTIFFNLDGVTHVMVGVRGNVMLSLKNKAIPKFRFEFKGLSAAMIFGVAPPAATYANFIDPVPVSPEYTTASLFGYQGGVESIDINAGAQIEPRIIINSRSIQYVDRQATGSIVLDAPDAGDVDFFGKAIRHETDTLALTHGIEDGNIIEVDAPVVQLKLPKYGESQKIVTNSIDLIFKPTSAGNNELKITVK